MANEQYVKKMFEEFRIAYGIGDTVANFSKYKSSFNEWVDEKRKAARVYGQLLAMLEKGKDDVDISNELIVELGKGASDSAAKEISLATNRETAIVSPFADTFKKDNGLKIYDDGIRILRTSNAIIKNCDLKEAKRIDVMVTQLPLSENQLVKMVLLMTSNSDIFIGTYGSMDDNDSYGNLAALSIINDKLARAGLGDIRSFQFYSEKQNGYYAATIKCDAKKKTKVKKISLEFYPRDFLIMLFYQNF